VIGPGGVLTVRGNILGAPTAGGGQPLSIPYLLVPRGLSSVAASAAGPFVKQRTNNVYNSSTTVTNSGLHSGTADVYAWGIHDAKDLAGSAGQDIRDVGVQSFSDGTVVFAVNGWNHSATQDTQEYDIAIDLQNDGKPDYLVVGVDLGAVLTGTFDGRFGSFTIDAKTGDVVDAFFADAPMNGSTALLPTTLGDLGLRGANTSFHYAVAGFSVLGGDVDTTSAATFDAAHSGVSTGQFATLASGATTRIPLWADYDKLQSAPALGWLVVNVDDAAGAAQADEVPLGTLK
jgi:minor extracellular serine protease Vpr